MKVGEKKKGTDGNMWIVKKVKNGSKRWMKVKKEEESVDCKDLVVYEKKTKKWLSGITVHSSLIGLKGPDNTVYKFTSYNKFEKTPTKIPDGYKKKSISSKKKHEYYCGTKKILGKDNEEFKKIKHTGYKRYYTHYNYDRPYLVYLGKKDAYIYKIPEDMEVDSSDYSKKDDDNRWMYIKLVEHIKFIKSFVGKSPINRMTKFSGGHGKGFDGNSILLQKNKNNYVFIGHIIDNFKVFDDKIIKFVSPVGNNDVPYPYAIGKKNIYCFSYPEGYLPIKYFTNIKNDDLFNDELREYDPFFITFGKKKSRHKITLEEFKKIQKKPLQDISLDTIKTLAKMFSVVNSGSKKTVADRIEQVRGVKVYNVNKD